MHYKRLSLWRRFPVSSLHAKNGRTTHISRQAVENTILLVLEIMIWACIKAGLSVKLTFGPYYERNCAWASTRAVSMCPFTWRMDLEFVETQPQVWLLCFCWLSVLLLCSGKVFPRQDPVPLELKRKQVSTHEQLWKLYACSLVWGIYLKPEKGNRFGWSLFIDAIIGSTPGHFALGALAVLVPTIPQIDT